MRTTFTLDEDAAALAQNYAKARSLRLGKAVSELIRRASMPPLALKKEGELWVVAAPADKPKFSAAQIKDIMEESP